MAAVVAHSTAKVRGLTIAVSVAFHAALTAGLFRAAELHDRVFDPPPHESPPEEAIAGPMSIDLPEAGEGDWTDPQPIDTKGEPPRVFGGDVVARLDTASQGHGGEVTSSLRALNLADKDDRMRLSPDLLSRLDRDQLQRLRVARRRASWEDRRSTTHPTELTLVVTGPGEVRERRDMSTFAPSRGELASRPASVRGAELGVATARPPPSAARVPTSSARRWPSRQASVPFRRTTSTASKTSRRRCARSCTPAARADSRAKGSGAAGDVARREPGQREVPARMPGRWARATE